MGLLSKLFNKSRVVDQADKLAEHETMKIDQRQEKPVDQIQTDKIEKEAVIDDKSNIEIENQHDIEIENKDENANGIKKADEIETQKKDGNNQLIGGIPKSVLDDMKKIPKTFKFDWLHDRLTNDNILDYLKKGLNPKEIVSGMPLFMYSPSQEILDILEYLGADLTARGFHYSLYNVPYFSVERNIDLFMKQEYNIFGHIKDIEGMFIILCKRYSTINLVQRELC